MYKRCKYHKEMQDSVSLKYLRIYILFLIFFLSEECHIFFQCHERKTRVSAKLLLFDEKCVRQEKNAWGTTVKGSTEENKIPKE